MAPMLKDFARGKAMHDALDIFNRSHEHHMGKALHRARQHGLPVNAVEQAQTAKRAFDRARHVPTPETRKILASLTETVTTASLCMKASEVRGQGHSGSDMQTMPLSEHADETLSRLEAKLDRLFCVLTEPSEEEPSIEQVPINIESSLYQKFLKM